MNTSDIAIVVLAAGKGKRMQSHVAKPLHRLCNKPLINHVIEQAYRLNPQGLHVVYNENNLALVDALSAYEITWIPQQDPKGTGHAVTLAMPHMVGFSHVMVLLADVPMITTHHMHMAVANPADVVLMTAHVDQPDGLGRVFRDKQGKISIIEEQDATIDQKRITEVWTGALFAPYIWLSDALSNISNDNAQQEYYLGDVIDCHIASIDAMPLPGVRIAGINTPQELLRAQAMMHEITV